MIFSFVLILTGIVNVVCYAVISKKLRSWTNCFSIYFGSTIVIDVVFGFLGLSAFGASGSTYAFVFCYTANMFMAITMMLTVQFIRPPKLHWLPRPSRFRVRWWPWILLGLGILIYMPVLIKFRESLLHPRDIYVQTRTGYGVYYLISIFLANVAFTLRLFQDKKKLAGSVIFTTATAILLALHGSKGSFLTPALIYLIFQVHVLQKRFTLRQSALSSLALAAVVVVAFFGTSNTYTFQDNYNGMVAVTDYTRNAMEVIDKPMPDYPFLGRLLLESEAYARVPRILYPGKPKTFGYFRIAAWYFPDQFDSDSGASSFGNVGPLYADFGPAALLVVIIIGAFNAYFMMGLIRSLQRSPSLLRFIMLCFLSGAGMIPISAVFVLPETFIVGFMLERLIAIRRLRRASPTFQSRTTPSRATQ